MSKKPKKTRARIELILENLRKGITKKAACSQAGIDRNTLYRWCETDKELAAEVEAAIDVSQSVLVNAVITASFTDWRAAAWMLERRFPESFAAKRDVEVNINKSDGTDVVVGMIAQAQALLINEEGSIGELPPSSSNKHLDEPTE